MKGIELENGKYGRRAVVTAFWTHEMAEYINRNNILELELNHGKGWRGADIGFLSSLPQLQGFEITDLTISSVEPVHVLRQLRSLKIMTYCQTELRFSSFPFLEECVLEWRPKATSIFECTTLRKLFINRYQGQDVMPFGNLYNLESLSILNGPINTLLGLGPLEHLNSLRLAGLTRLSSLAGLDELSTLTELDINTCRAFSTIDPLALLKALVTLRLDNDGKIESLKPLDGLPNLESVSFVESTNIIDGDLTPLVRLKHLNRITFQNRRHYTHRREDFGAAYFGVQNVKK